MMAFHRRLLVLFIAAVAAIKIDADRATEMQAPFLSLYMAAEEGRLDVVRKSPLRLSLCCAHLKLAYSARSLG